MDLDPANLFVSFMVGLVGMAMVMWGRSQKRIPAMAAGVLLIAATFLVPGWLLLLVVTAIVVGGLVLATKAGM
jgi:predicted branched-subunit amino acid permease